MHLLIKYARKVLPIFFFLNATAQLTPYEKDPQKNTTATYQEMIDYYQTLAKKYPKQSKLFTCGKTDVGKPLQLFVLSKSGEFSPEKLKKSGNAIFLINNGIHPGEPEGIDASMMLARDLLAKNALPDNEVIAIITAYNLGGMLNRGESRVNQNGPVTYGFRGNRRNLDLNRDFIKTDSKNSYSFQEIFNSWDPDVFLDNHTSDGADYQYIMTLIDTQRDKLTPILGKYMKEKFTDELYKRMATKDYKLIPYIDFPGETPESGIEAYLETPRYSTGFAALHNTIAYMPETHMWKPFQQRVESTYQLMVYLKDIIHEQGNTLLATRRKAKDYVKNQTTFPLRWKLDTTKYANIPFYGYEAEHKPSEVSGLTRLYYNRDRPFTRTIKLYDRYQASLTINKPKAYIIPQCYDKAISLLQLNHVKLMPIKQDTIVHAEVYYIKDFPTNTQPYEGHYLHHDITLEKKMMDVPFYKGDYMAFTNQESNRYLIETLEPEGVDSYFCWNFFDGILSRKEYFSPYIFEDKAAELLKKNPQLRTDLDNAIDKNPSLKNDAHGQLEWIYQHSNFFEKTYKLYPIARIL
ncbi:M14 family zinc carboxypeptidase [Rhizosphaericola mali]|uniref:Peptidase M14 domain-containing protein n=1 Tax=Rhizosphaericola mali TaxID=2545455 RepID=A0A5P2GAY5_9BACT|nr:M14 family zinc carboxypeptidase [Rhizosphaericola mali]QES90850.1 hypothetical protein E0W69_020095 [Rhizosphaericola mali]